MAIWQVDMHLVDTTDDPPEIVGDGWVPRLLSAQLARRAQLLLSEYLGPPWQMVEDWVVYGPENGSRVDVVCEPSGAASIVIRFDVRNDNIQFLALICRLARSLECAFFSSDTRVLAEPTETGLGKVIDAVHNAIVLRNLKMG